MAKNAKLISAALNGSVITFTVGDAGSFDFDMASVPGEIAARARLHGFVQKISDAAAMPKSELTGNAKKDAATKLEAMKSVAERLVGPDANWSKRSGDGTGPVTGLIRRAFAEYARNMAAAKKATITDEKIDEVYDAKSRSDQLALRTVPEIAAIIERLKSERGSKSESVNTDELLSDLGI
jgi:hypothetical protein